MASEKREWTVPPPIRALLWWPPAAFVLVMIVPGAAATSIAVSGIALMTLGAIVPVIARGLGRAPSTRTRMDQDPPTVEMQTIEMSTVEFPPVRRAA